MGHGNVGSRYPQYKHTKLLTILTYFHFRLKSVTLDQLPAVKHKLPDVVDVATTHVIVLPNLFWNVFSTVPQKVAHILY